MKTASLDELYGIPPLALVDKLNAGLPASVFPALARAPCPVDQGPGEGSGNQRAHPAQPDAQIDRR